MPFDRHLLQGGSMRPWRCWKGISHMWDNRWTDLWVWERWYACDVDPELDALVVTLADGRMTQQKKLTLPDRVVRAGGGRAGMVIVGSNL